MAISDVSITSAMRNTLTSLQTTSKLLDRTQNRLATGKKVNSALDNPVNFFAAQNATQRASDLSSRKDGISEAIQGVLAANAGVTGITALIESAKGLTQSARSSDRDGRNMLATQFNGILDQITAMAGDSQYKGKNFLKSDKLQVLFNENGSAYLDIQGFSATATGLGLSTVTVGTADVTTPTIAAGSGFSTATTVIHQATINTSVGNNSVATGTYFAMSAASAVAGATYNSGTMSGMTIAGVSMASGNTGGVTMTGIFIGVATGMYMDTLRGTGTTWTGLNAHGGGVAYSITAVYVNGMTIAAADWTYCVANSTAGASNQTTGLGLSLFLNGTNITSGAYVGLSGLSSYAITYDIRVEGHQAGSNNLAASSLTVFDLQGSDVASGAQIANMDATATPLCAAIPFGKSGARVYISGVVANTDTYYYSTNGNNNYLIFTGAAVPSTIANAVQYNYNSGFSTVNGAALSKKSAFSSVALGANQTITNIKVNGASEVHVTIAGSGITFATGFEPADGAQVTYDIVTAGTVGSWETDANISTAIDLLDNALSSLRASSQTLGSSQNILDIRTNFTDTLVTTLLKGADNLTLADMNEEGANMLMLQTRQSLGTSTLKMASDSAQSIMRLF